MKKITLIFAVLLICGFSKAQQRKVLVEVFTNSHCSQCPPAHQTLENYRVNNANSANVDFIYYHMAYPYSDDALYQANTGDPSTRNLYYGPFSSTPDAFFDGKIQNNNYSEWASGIDARINVQPQLKINLSGSKGEGNFTVNAEVEAVNSISANDLVLHFVVVENVNYQGRNGVSPQFFVMRKMLADANGKSITISNGETKNYSQQIELSSGWINDSLSVVVFVQSSSTKDVFQSEMISYNSLSVTGVENNQVGITTYKLEQNYPNPFNPTTIINYGIPKASYVVLRIYNTIGQEIRTLISQNKNAGSHQSIWDGKDSYGNEVSSGTYIYRITAGDYAQAKKMILLR